MKYLLLFTAILAEVAGTSALKFSDGFSRPLWAVASLVAYAIAFYFLSLTLRSMPTGIAYAIWSGVGIVLVSLTSWWMLDQKLDAPAVAGMALIVTGVVVLMSFSRMDIH